MAIRNPFTRTNTTSDTGPLSTDRKAQDRADRQTADWDASRPARAARHRRQATKVLRDAEDYRIGWGRRR